VHISSTRGVQASGRGTVTTLVVAGCEVFGQVAPKVEASALRRSWLGRAATIGFDPTA